MAGKLEEGTVFAGRYRVLRGIAAGGMGAIYEVVHLETHRHRALKVMHPHLFQSDDMRERFAREARIAAQIDSEYIVDVSDAGIDEATKMPFLVMELLRGEELGDRLKRLGRLPPEEVVTYMQQAAWALDRTHAASVVHRDLKPENLFSTHREDGTPRIKILDFGVAKLVAEGATGAGATRSLGTPLYMAPEQFRANIRLTGAADIHALTLMTYTLLVGKPYWLDEAQSTGDVIAFAVLAVQGPKESAVERAARRGVALPAGFDAWFSRGTAVNPLDRFPTASEAVRALREIDGGGRLDVESIAPKPTSIAPNPARVSSSATPSLSGGHTPSTASAVESAATSTGVAMSPPPPERRWRSIIGIGAALAMGLGGLGAWAALRAKGATPVPSSTTLSLSAVSQPPPPASASVRLAPPASASARADDGTEVTAAPSPPSASSPVATLPMATPAAPPPRPPPSGRSTPHPAPSARKPAAPPVAAPLLGRD